MASDRLSKCLYAIAAQESDSNVSSPFHMSINEHIDNFLKTASERDIFELVYFAKDLSKKDKEPANMGELMEKNRAAGDRWLDFEEFKTDSKTFDKMINSFIDATEQPEVREGIIEFMLIKNKGLRARLKQKYLR